MKPLGMYLFSSRIDLVKILTQKVLSVLANQGGYGPSGRWTEPILSGVSPLGTVWGKGEAGFYCLTHKKLDHWEVSAFAHQAKVLGETQIMVSHSGNIPYHLAFLGFTSMKTYR